VSQVAEVDALLLDVGQRWARAEPLDQRVQTVVAVCREDLAQVGSGADASDDLLIWHLGRPGGLVGMLGPLESPDQTWVRTWPVLLASVLLGLAGLVSVVAGSRAPGLVSTWLSAPLAVGSAGVAVLVVVALLAADRYLRRVVGTRAAAASKRELFQLETVLLQRINRLRASIRRPHPGDALVRAAGEISWAAGGLGRAAQTIAASGEVVDRLRAVAFELVEALPGVTAQAPVLASLDQRIRDTAAEVGRSIPPLTELVSATLDAATLVREAIVTAGEQLRNSVVLAERTADQHDALSTGERPFTVAAVRLESASGVLDATAAALRDTLERMQAAIDKANWLVLVADGMRADDELHAAPGEPC
jgi:hypothetical protein